MDLALKLLRRNPANAEGSAQGVSLRVLSFQAWGAGRAGILYNPKGPKYLTTFWRIVTMFLSRYLIAEYLDP